MKIWLHTGEDGFIRVNFFWHFFRFIMAWPLYVEGIFSNAFFKQIFWKLAISKPIDMGSFSFFLGKKPPEVQKPTKLCPLIGIVNLLPWIFLGKTSHDLFWSLWAKEGQGYPQKAASHRFQVFRVPFSAWRPGTEVRGDWGSRSVGEDLFKGKNYSGFIWFIDLNEQLSLCM